MHINVILEQPNISHILQTTVLEYIISKVFVIICGPAIQLTFFLLLSYDTPPQWRKATLLLSIDASQNTSAEDTDISWINWSMIHESAFINFFFKPNSFHIVFNSSFKLSSNVSKSSLPTLWNIQDSITYRGLHTIVKKKKKTLRQLITKTVPAFSLLGAGGFPLHQWHSLLVFPCR